MADKRITRLRPLAYVFWALVLLLGGVLAALLYWDAEPALSPDGTPRDGCSTTSPCLAVVVDDIGRDLAPLERLLRLQAPITYSVLPHARHTARSVRLIRQKGREIIAHLPMRPLDTGAVSDEALVLGMDGPLETVLLECLNRIPGAVGVSNHMGSQLTQQVGAMTRVMRLVKKRRLWALDSRTTLRSVMCSEARRQRIPCLDRDVFLDHDPGLANIQFQLRKAVARAKQRGWAIAIGHPYPETVGILESFLRRPGVQIVPVSALVSRLGLKADNGGGGKKSRPGRKLGLEK